MRSDAELVGGAEAGDREALVHASPITRNASFRLKSLATSSLFPYFTRCEEETQQCRIL